MEKNKNSDNGSIDNDNDVFELFNKYIRPFWKEYFISALLFAFLFTMLSYCVTPKYEATVKLQINSNGNSSSRLGGLASLAGINMASDGGTDVRFNINYLQSREIAEVFIESTGLRKKLFEENLNRDGEFEARKGGVLSFLRKKKEGGENIIDEDVYDTPGPTKGMTYQRFRNVFRVTINDKEMSAEVSVFWKDPRTAKYWANGYVNYVNSRLKSKAISESQKKIEYLKSQLEQNSSVEVQRSIYSLIEAELKRIALAESTDQYAFKIVERAFLPERKVSPKRDTYLIMGAFGGLIVAFAWSFLKSCKGSV